jgi:uncharacterized protein YqeY
MKSLKDLQREKLLLHSSDKIRSEAIGGLIYGAKAIAKENKREVLESDLITSAKRTIKALSSTLPHIPKESELYKNYEYQIRVLKEFVPEPPSKELVSSTIHMIIRETGIGNIKGMGTIMKVLKQELPNVDGKMASDLIKEALL